jgi:hypothetical protein
MNGRMECAAQRRYRKDESMWRDLKQSMIHKMEKIYLEIFMCKKQFGMKSVLCKTSATR